MGDFDKWRKSFQSAGVFERSSRYGATDETYAQWNQAVGSWFFDPTHGDNYVCLSVDSGVLRESMNRHLGVDRFETDHDARDDFLDSVRRELKRRRNDWIWVETPVRDVLPDFLALLAVQTLAVSELGDEGMAEGLAGNNLWNRLAGMLRDVPLHPGPRFYEQHQGLWREGLEKWSRDIQGGRWGMVELPQDGGSHRHVRLPYSQALLRTSDLRRLDSFFRECRLEPKQKISRKKLEQLIDVCGRFSRYAGRVLQDLHRREGALRQIEDSLAVWDGKADSLRRPRRSFVRRDVSMSVSVSVRRSAIRELVVRFEQSAEGKIVELAEQDLGELFRERVCTVCVGGLTYRPRKLDLVVTRWDEARRAYVESARIGREDRALLFVRSDVLKEWASHDVYRWLTIRQLDRSGVGEHVCDAIEMLAARGWEVVKCSVIDLPSDDALPWMEFIERDRPRLTLSGGLRLGRREWLEGAPPRIEVVGMVEGWRIAFDGDEYPLGESAIDWSRLGDAGKHVVSLLDRGGRVVGSVAFVSRPAHDAAGADGERRVWTYIENGWPAITRTRTEAETLAVAWAHGPCIGNRWPRRKKTVCASTKQQAVRQLVAERSGVRFPEPGSVIHPLAYVGRTQTHAIGMVSPLVSKGIRDPSPLRGRRGP